MVIKNGKYTSSLYIALSVLAILSMTGCIRRASSEPEIEEVSENSKKVAYSEMSTDELGKLLMDDPQIPIVLAFDRPKDGLSKLKSESEVFREFSSRDDATEWVIDYYRWFEYDPENHTGQLFFRNEFIRVYLYAVYQDVDTETKKMIDQVFQKKGIHRPGTTLTGKTFPYSGNTKPDSEKWIDFSITLYPDGSYEFSESPMSSYHGTGRYTIEMVGGLTGEVLVLYEDDELGYPGMKNYFKYEDNKLTFIEKGSSNFIWVKLQDGEVFQTE